jgi:hypothetical protein
MITDDDRVHCLSAKLIKQNIKIYTEATLTSIFMLALRTSYNASLFDFF